VARNLLLAGSLIVAGECSAVVYATGMHTELGRIAHLTQTAGDTESPLQVEIRRVSRLVALLALGLGLVFFAIGQAIGLPFWVNFMFAIGIIVANVPEGLLPTVTLALALATQRMARRNALVRHLPAVETLGSATTILTDKTGTLTQNRMSVREIFAGGRHRLAAERWPAGGDFHLRAVARFCHSLKFPADQPAGDPMEIALWQFAGPIPEPGERRGEIAFDAERRRMSVITRHPDGSGQLWCKGAPRRCCRCTHWMDGDTARPWTTTRGASAAPTPTWPTAACGCWPWPGAPRGERRGRRSAARPGRPGRPRRPAPPRRARGGRALPRGRPAGHHGHRRPPAHRRGGGPRGEHRARPEPAGDQRRGPPRHGAGGAAARPRRPEIVFARVSAEQKMLIVQALQRRARSSR
jgi:sodium/potassium-transporting ATPase subunit alpha